MLRLALPVVAIALAGCQTSQPSEELPKPPVMERMDGRSVSESEAMAEAGRRDIAACNTETARADKAGTLPMSPELRMSLLQNYSHARVYAAYERAKIEVYVGCMERRGYRRSARSATLRLAPGTSSDAMP